MAPTIQCLNQMEVYTGVLYAKSYSGWQCDRGVKAKLAHGSCGPRLTLPHMSMNFSAAAMCAYAIY